MDLRTVVTASQLAPLDPSRTPSDVIDAIRRQGRARPMEYYKGRESAAVALRQPTLRGFVTGTPSAHLTRTTQSFHSPMLGQRHHVSADDGRRIAGNHGNKYTDGRRLANNDPSLGLRINGLNTTDLKGGQCSPSESPRGYSVAFDEKGNMSTMVNNNGVPHKGGQWRYQRKVPVNVPGGNTVTVQHRQVAKLSFTHKDKISPMLSLPNGYNRLVSAADTIDISHHVNSENEVGDKTQYQREDVLSATGNKKTLGRTVSTDLDGAQTPKRLGLRRSKTMDDTPDAPSDDEHTERMTSLQLADKILMTSDLDHMSQLCNKKQSYTDFIEQNEPHRLGYGFMKPLVVEDILNTNYSTDGIQTHDSGEGLIQSPQPSPRVATQSSSATGLPSSFTPTLPTTSSVTPAPLYNDMARNSQNNTLLTAGTKSARTECASTRRKLFQKRKLQALRPIKSSSLSENELVIDSTSNTPYSLSSMNTKIEPEIDYEFAKKAVPEIDYEKPVTIVIETNNNPLHKTTKPILKPIVRKHYGDFDSRLSSPSTINDHSAKFAKTSVFRQNSASKEKGRLVRFSGSHKVHEFAPMDPVRTG